MEIIWIKSFPYHPDIANNQIIYNRILSVCTLGPNPIIYILTYKQYYLWQMFWHDTIRAKERRKEEVKREENPTIYVDYRKMLNACVNLCRASYSFKLNLELMRDFVGFQPNKRFY